MPVSRSENPGKRRVAPLAAAMAALALGASGALAHDISQSGEQKDMRRVGHVDLQGRPAYQPNVIVYPNKRTIAFVGTHGGSKPNPLKPGSPVEQNGTMIIDVTDPEKPVEKFHIPVPIAGGQAQMARMCLGSDLPHGTGGHVYLMRNVQGTTASGYEVWDVTNVTAPTLVGEMRGIRNTHKVWWECKTGIAYMPGSRDVPAPNRWRQGQSMVVADWSNPAAPKYIRTFGLQGGQPDAPQPARYPPRCTAPSAGSSIRKPHSRWRAQPGRAMSSATAFMPHGVSGTTAYSRSWTARSCCRRRSAEPGSGTPTGPRQPTWKRRWPGSSTCRRTRAATRASRSSA